MGHARPASVLWKKGSIIAAVRSARRLLNPTEAEPRWVLRGKIKMSFGAPEFPRWNGAIFWMCSNERSPGRTGTPTNALIHTQKCTQHDRLVGKTRLCKASPDFPTPLDVSLATEVDFLLCKKGGEGVCVCVCVCDFWRVLFYRVCPQMRCGGGCLANCGAISSRRIPVNEGRLPASPPASVWQPAP